jgi:hypothetical protein
MPSIIQIECPDLAPRVRLGDYRTTGGTQAPIHSTLSGCAVETQDEPGEYFGAAHEVDAGVTHLVVGMAVHETMVCFSSSWCCCGSWRPTLCGLQRLFRNLWA